MAYAKFITKSNKEGRPVRYGPYYYKSVRTPEGKVRNIYLGTKAREEKESANGIKWVRDALAGLRRL